MPSAPWTVQASDSVTHPTRSQMNTVNALSESNLEGEGGFMGLAPSRIRDPKSFPMLWAQEGAGRKGPRQSPAEIIMRIRVGI